MGLSAGDLGVLYVDINECQEERMKKFVDLFHKNSLYFNCISRVIFRTLSKMDLSKMETFAKIVNGLKLLNVFKHNFNLDV